MTTSTLDVQHVSKVYWDGETQVRAVQDISLTVAPGEIVLIMRPSGSGKTTLLSMLGALLRPTEGRITLNGEDLTAAGEGRLPGIRLRQFGFVFQDFNLLSALSALENVAIVAQLSGLRNGAARTKAAGVLEALGLGKRLNFLPEKMSGGEKQRVAIARALVNDPAIILADEPTGNLDSKTGDLVLETFQELHRQGRTVIIITHEPYVAAHADRTLVIKDGELVEDRGKSQAKAV